MIERVIDLTDVATKTVRELTSSEAVEYLWGLPVRECIVRCRDCEHFTANEEFWVKHPSVPFPFIGATSVRGWTNERR